jgi:hypothetical protein
MATGIKYANVGDLANHVLPKFHKKRKFEAFVNKQKYRIVDELAAEKKQRIGYGNRLEWRLLTGSTSPAQFIDMFQPTRVDHADLFSSGSAPWRHGETKAVYNNIIAADSKDEAELVNYLWGQYFVAVAAAVDLIEDAAFMQPNDADDTKSALGIPYCLPYLNSGTVSYEGGFLGQTARFADGSSTNTIYGTNRNALPITRSYAINHQGTVDANWVYTALRAATYCDFKEPRDLRAYYQPSASDWRFFTSMDDKLEYDRLCDMTAGSRNRDMLPAGINPNKFIAGMRVMDVPTLNGRAGRPSYGVNLAHFFMFVHSQFWMKWDKAVQLADRHTFEVAMDFRFNFACDNPRKAGFVMHTAGA